ncbi:MAG TPA: acetate uptake transporter [Candidatus Binataceae bacterium]|nr:acetate uptake transporter [Candidatus Binataceae bacterium]
MLRPGKDKGLATPLPLGLAALGTTIVLMGVAAIFQSSASLSPYLIQALLFGGLLELLAGMWAFAYGDPLAATTFSFMGAFFGWWGFSQMPMLDAHAAAAVATNSIAMVFLVTGAIVACLWVASFYEFAAFNLVLFFLCAGLILSGIASFDGNVALRVIGGVAAIISGLIASYAAFAEIYNSTSLEEVVPVGESKEIRARAEHDEMERIRRIHRSNHTEHEAEARRA